MKNPRSNTQKFRLEGLELGPGIYLVHQLVPQGTQVTSDSVLRNTRADAHPVFNSDSPKLWLPTCCFDMVVCVCVGGGKALNIYFRVPISACTGMEFPLENFKLSFEIYKTHDRSWQASEQQTLLDLTSPASLHYTSDC